LTGLTSSMRAQQLPSTTPPTVTGTAESACAISQSPQYLTHTFSSFASFISADGTVYLVAGQDTQSILYKYDGYGDFVSHQTLSSAPDMGKVHAFTVGATQYVALPYYSDGTTLDYMCELFIFNESSFLLTSAQNISTMGVRGVSAVSAQNGETYLAVSNSRNQAGIHNIDSYIMRYNSTTQSFDHFQNITTHGACPPEFFLLGGETFLVIPNNYNGLTSTLGSDIYKLDAASAVFFLNQTIVTFNVRLIRAWTYNSLQLLFVANSARNFVDVYVFNATQSMFVLSGDRLYSQSCGGADVMDIADSMYVAVSSLGDPSASIYTLNDTTPSFAQTQQLTLTSGWFIPHIFTAGADTLLALADHVYKFCDGKFVLL
jgi:hypothetical protein